MSNVEWLVNNMYRAGLVYSLVAYYWITWVCETGYTITHKTVRAAINAHRGQEFVFLARNSCPWQRHVQDEELGVLRIQYPLVYNVNDCHFEFPMDPMREGVRSFSTVVTVDLVNKDETITFDLSSFFHELSWDAGEYSPTLFEVVLTYCLENDLLFTLDKISGFRLKVFTNDGENHIIQLDSDFAQSRFVIWYENASPAPSATSDIEDIIEEIVEDIIADIVEESPTEAVVENLPDVVEDSLTLSDDGRPYLETPPSAPLSDVPSAPSSDAFEA